MSAQPEIKCHYPTRLIQATPLLLFGFPGQCTAAGTGRTFTDRILLGAAAASASAPEKKKKKPPRGAVRFMVIARREEETAVVIDPLPSQSPPLIVKEGIVSMHTHTHTHTLLPLVLR